MRIIDIVAGTIVIGVALWLGPDGASNAGRAVSNIFSHTSTDPAPSTLPRATSDTERLTAHQKALKQGQELCAALTHQTGGTCQTVITDP